MQLHFCLFMTAFSCPFLRSGVRATINFSKISTKIIAYLLTPAFKNDKIESNKTERYRIHLRKENQAMKKHPITRLMLSVTSLVLIIASMMCMTVACSQNGDGKNSSSATTAPAVTTADPDAGKYDDAGYLKDALPEVANLGVKIGMLYWSDV